MHRINLLPWREEQRKQKQKEYMTQLGLVALLGLGIILGAHTFLSQKISAQESRNNRLDQEIKLVDQRLKEIKELEVVKKALVDRMEVIQQLQESRPEVVHLFDDLNNTLPEGLFLTLISQEGTTLTIEGKSESNARVSTYMRNLEKSKWLDNATLLYIEAKKAKPDEKKSNIRSFSLMINQITPNAVSEETGS